MAWGHKSEYRQRVRAQIVVHAARGRSNAPVARETRLHLDTVRRWRRRFAEQGLAGLRVRQRSGRPSSLTPVQAAEVKALACWPSAESGVPLSRWSCPQLAREAITGASSPSCRPPLCATGSRPTRSSRGSTTPGSSSLTRTSVPGPSVYLTCMPAPSRAPRWRRVRHQRGREDLRPGPSPPARPEQCGSTRPTGAAAPWPTRRLRRPPGEEVFGRAARKPLASCRSWLGSLRS
ncbi:helix-turn-helix domain-containing protein [Streptomyces sp. 900116325]